MEAKLIGLGVETFKMALLLSLPMLLGGLIAGLLISIFQATTQINEMTLSFVPKILLVVTILIFLMPWMRLRQSLPLRWTGCSRQPDEP